MCFSLFMAAVNNQPIKIETLHFFNNFGMIVRCAVPKVIKSAHG